MSAPEPTPGRISLRAFARARGVTVQAVRENIAKGHIAAVARDVRTGHPYITDMAAAMAQWDANVLTNPHQTFAGERALPGEARPNARHPDGRDQRPVKVSPLAQVALRQKQVQVRLAELELARKASQLIDARLVSRGIGDVTTELQTGVQAITSRLRQLQPDLPAQVYADLDMLIVEALDCLAKWSSTFRLPLFEEATDGHRQAAAQ